MPKILVVDDDSMVRATLADALNDSGYEVAQAVDGDDCLDALVRDSFDLIVLDILMPQREGLETLREIRKTWTALPVLAISGGGRSGSSDVLRAAHAFGANDTMAKPFDSYEFVERVAQLLEAPRH